MYIISYNVNGIRSAVSKGLVEWIEEEAPDVLCIQETKAQSDQIPSALFEAAGYNPYWFSAERRGYSGVGIVSRLKPDYVEYGMGMEVYDREGRVIRADFGDVTVVSVYHPNGSSGQDRHWFKMRWLEDFLAWAVALKKMRPRLIIAGDFNICHKPIDIHDPVRHATSSGFLPEEREWVSRFIDAGFVDSFRQFDQSPDQYTWWSFRANAQQKNLGWRIDYNMVSKELAPEMKNAGIMPDIKHADHCPAWVLL